MLAVDSCGLRRQPHSVPWPEPTAAISPEAYFTKQASDEGADAAEGKQVACTTYKHRLKKKGRLPAIKRRCLQGFFAAEDSLCRHSMRIIE